MGGETFLPRMARMMRIGRDEVLGYECLRTAAVSPFLLGELTEIYSPGQRKTCWLAGVGQRALLIDACHFSAPNKRDREGFYEPISEALRRSEQAGPQEALRS